MIPERSLEVLRAIVEDFISHNQPVGSKSLLQRHPLGVSAATIRNDMALLEEESLITAPHTSSGRIPTEKGYRLFVDQLSQVKPMSMPEKQAIESFLGESPDLDETVERSARLLAQLTNLLAVVQYPSLGKSSVRHVELIDLHSSRVMLMLILDSGRVQQLLIDADPMPSSELILDLRGRLNGMICGSPLGQIESKLLVLPESFAPESRHFVQRVVDSVLTLVEQNRQDKVVISGAANLVRREQDFNGELGAVLAAIEEQIVTLRLLDELSEQQFGVGIRIGSELKLDGVSSASLMASGYQNQGSEVAKLGVLGPLRMDYSAGITNVSAVAGYLSKVLAGRV